MVLLHNRSDGQIEEVVSQSVQYATVEELFGYLIEGIILAFINLPIVALVAAFPLLRKQKEMIMVAGISFADGFHGSALIVASIGRISLIVNGNGYILRSRWQCLLTSWNLMFVLSWQMAPYMLLMISVDRLLAVTKPFKYYKFTNRYATLLVGAFYAPIIPVAVACAVSSYQYQFPENPAECLIQWAYSEWYLIFLYSVRITTATASVLLFIPILVILQRKRRENTGTDAAQQMKRLRSVTLTLGISSFFSIFFVVLPDIVFITGIGNVSSLILFGLNNCNAIMNIFIYTMRFKDLRTCLKKIILCRMHKGSSVQPTMFVNHSYHVTRHATKRAKT